MQSIVGCDELRAIQTPQLFHRVVLENAYRQAALDGVTATDDAALVERIGHCVRVVPGRVTNFKVTTQLDFIMAEILLARRRPDPRSLRDGGHERQITLTSAANVLSASSRRETR
jgi:2-C-methyl-D-erythritol 4-phosphate cytidylyltransferase